MFGRKTVVFLSAAVAATLLFAVTAEGQMQQQQQEGQQQRESQGQKDPWSPQSSYNQKFQPEQLQRVQGTIESTETFRPAEGAKQGVMLTIKTSDGQTKKVHVGPQEFVQQQGAEFSEGDQIIIIGAPAQFEGEEVMMAALIQTSDKVLQLRDSRGRPQWAETTRTRDQQRTQQSGQQGAQQSGQQSAQQQQQQQQQAGQFQPQLLNADTLIGTDVKGADGETLGQIQDVVLNQKRDKVDYVAIGSGGFLGIGTKYVAVPWDDLTVQRTDRNKIESITLEVSKDQWQELEGFETDNWPQSADPNWKQGSMQPGGQADQQAARQEGTSPTERSVPGTTQGEYGRDQQARRQQGQDQQAAAAGAQGDMKYRRLSQIMGLPVKNMQQEDLGSIENVILDMREGRPVFSIVQFGGFLGLGARKATVPWASVDIMPQLEVARVDVSQEVLRAVAYEEGNEPDLTQMSEVESIYRRFNEEPYWQTYGYMEGGQDTSQQRRQDMQKDSQKKQQEDMQKKQ